MPARACRMRDSAAFDDACDASNDLFCRSARSTASCKDSRSCATSGRLAAKARIARKRMFLFGFKAGRCAFLGLVTRAGLVLRTAACIWTEGVALQNHSLVGAPQLLGDLLV